MPDLGGAAKTHQAVPDATADVEDIKKAMIVLEGTSPDTGGIANTSTRIELDGSASAVDGAYDPAAIYITGGTGSGQARQIWQYDGANKYAYVNRDWKVTPDNTSEYTIAYWPGDTHVNEGLAQGGGANTITLNTLASAQNSLYLGQMIFIVAGTGADQARMCVGYNGGTKIVTVDSNWIVNPDNTSIYAMLPYPGFVYGVPGVNSAANTLIRDVVGQKGDTAAGDSLYAYLLQILAAVGGGANSHLPLFTGAIWYSDAAQPDDTGDGMTPDTAKQTIGAGYALLSAGDALSVKAGAYDETGLDMSLAATELWCEAGVFIVNSTPGTCLTVSMAGGRVRGAHFVQAGGIGCLVTGLGNIFEDCVAVNCTIGYDINEHSNQFFRCTSAGHTVTGFDIGERNSVLRDCYSAGLGAATRGFYFSAAVVTRCLLNNCNSVGNATSGYEIVTGANYNIVAFSTSGGGDGLTVDDGQFNDWPGYIDQLATEQHEDIYPKSDGQGGAGDPVTISNETTDGAGGTRDDMNYWGDITTIIPPGEIAIRWLCIGIYIHAITGVDIQQWEIFFTYPNMYSAQNGGNDWDENETDLTVADGSIFEAGDYVWVAGADRPEGEIMLVDGAPVGNVVTLEREDTADGEAGLRYNYDTSGVGNMIFLVGRPGVMLYDGFEGDYSSANARGFSRYQWHAAKQLGPNAAMLIRMLNATDDGASEFDVRAIYED